MTEKYAFTHTIGKIIGEGLQFSLIHARCVQIGRQTISSHLTRKAVLISTNANIPMGGRSKNTIQIS